MMGSAFLVHNRIIRASDCETSVILRRKPFFVCYLLKSMRFCGTI